MDIEFETNRVEDFVDKGNYHAAINIAISAMNECRRNNNQGGTDHFLAVINGVVKKMATEFGSEEILGQLKDS